MRIIAGDDCVRGVRERGHDGKVGPVVRRHRISCQRNRAASGAETKRVRVAARLDDALGERCVVGINFQITRRGQRRAGVVGAVKAPVSLGCDITIKFSLVTPPYPDNTV